MIATTISQSKALLEAGIIQETADMIWILNKEDSVPSGYNLIVKQKWHTKRHLDNLQVPYTYAWSLGALWNLCKGKAIELCTSDSTAEEVITILVTSLICAHENGEGNEKNNIG